jgi:hypothetical protein
VPRTEQRIFISYRRSDTRAYAGWLHQILAERYGQPNVFRDLDSMEPGEHFPTRIARTIARCTAVFVLIGDGWLAPGPSGRPRLHDPDDWVRLELETAVQKGLQILPLLVADAAVPPRQALPPSLWPVLDRQSVRLRDDHFAADVRTAMSGLTDRREVEREYLGSARRTREERFSELFTLFSERVEKEYPSMRLPWRRAEALRRPLEAVVDVLEPDEEVVDLALGNVSDPHEKLVFSRETPRQIRDAVVRGILAFSTRRLIYVPRLDPDSTTAVWYRDVLDTKAGLGLNGVFTIVLPGQDYSVDVRPIRRTRELAGFVRDRRRGR